MSFTHLHVHSDFSLLNGLAKIDDLLDACEKEGLTSLAITDKNAIYGLVDFQVKAKERGIKPIFGAEILVAPNGMENKTASSTARKVNQLVLLAKNETGYNNLLKIVTIGQLEGFYYHPRVDYEVLKKHSEGLIALSGNSYGEVNELLANDGFEKAKEKAKFYNDIFGKDNFYLELQDHPDFEKQKKINNGLIKINKETNIPLVACGDVYYIKKEDADVHDILLCIKMNRKVDEGDRPNMKKFNLSFRTKKEMQDAFSHVPEALENTNKIADKCNFEIELGNTKLPYYPIPEGKTADDVLLEMCEEKLVEKFGDKITQEHRERMEYELGIIEKTGYASYFLIVQDFTNWARNNGVVVGPGRGSAAGSFVSYLTGITNMDPIEYKLLFERFLNPERVSMPDVDLDFADDKRDDVLSYVRRQYGADHVAQIITFGTMAARAAVRDAGRALGFAYGFCDQVAKLIPEFTSMDKALEEVPDFKRLHKENIDARDLIDSARRLEGLCRHSSVHACGVVITDKPVVEYTAMQRVSGDDEATVTQYASSTKFSAVEKIGLLKMDFLGLKNLTIIQNTLNMVKKIHGKDIDIEKIPLDDKKAYKLLQEGLTTGVFQLESSGMKRYLKLLKPSVLEDIIAMVALYRPGPMEWIPDFIDGKHGNKKVEYLHPKLETILADTYGVAVYQEQVMRIAQDLAGFTLGEADILRKAMGKKILKLIKEQKIKFVEGCINEGVKKEIAEKVFSFIEPFAGYGFNRSHAACYGLIGYQTAYLKAHYPAEFMAALMTADQGNTDRIAIEAAECRDMDIEVLPPDINESFQEFAVIYDENNANPRIRFGLNAIKNVGKPVAKEIVAERKRNGKYIDLTDICTRVTSKDLSKKSIDALAMVGALDDFAPRDDILASMPSIITFVKELRTNASSNQDSLFGNMELSRAEITLESVESSGKKQHLAWEKQLIGLYISDHPSNEYRDFLDHMCVPLNDLKQDRAGKAISVGGIVIAITVILTKKGKNMAFVTLEDGKSTTECLIFPNLFEESKELLIEGMPVVMNGNLSDKDDDLKFLAESIEEIDEEQNKYAQRVMSTRKKYGATKEEMEKKKQEKSKLINKQKLFITLPQNGTNEMIGEIKKALDNCEDGNTTIFLIHNDQKMKTSYEIDYNFNCEGEIEKLVGKENILLKK
ncbi:MAG: DNA polymerase III subunit alpha [Patescibacteria group bacterium]